MATAEGSYCPHCGSETHTGEYCTSCGEPIDDVDTKSAEGDEEDSSESDDYANLFGDVYWKKSAVDADLALLLAIPFLLPRRTFAEIFTGQLRWLLNNYPSVFEWWYYNHNSIAFILMGIAVLSHVRLDPDDVE